MRSFILLFVLTWLQCPCPQVSLALPALAKESDSSIKVPISYENAQVWRTPLQSQKDLDFFHNYGAKGEISLWSLNKNQADYLVLRNKRMHVYHKLKKKGLNHSVLIMDVQRRINATAVKPMQWTDSSLKVGHRLNFENYPTITVMDEYFEYIKDNYPSIARVSTIGYSVENRTIQMITISNGNPSNMAVVILGGQHAREWVSVTSALYFVNNIVTKYDQQPDYMKDKDWYIVPLLNPDGYEYSQTVDRLWSKNRSKNPNPDCPGVDLNRNFPTHWQVPGVTQNNQCGEDYAGPFALSEPETLALLNVMDAMGNKVPSAFIDLHAYGQIILYPWKKKESQFKTMLESTAEDMLSAIYNVTGQKYSSGTPTDMMYVVSGSAMDWFYSKGVSLVYAVETRDTGTHGFLLPPEQIEDSGKEILGAIRTLANSLEPTILMRGRSQHTWF